MNFTKVLGLEYSDKCYNNEMCASESISLSGPETLLRTKDEHNRVFGSSISSNFKNDKNKKTEKAKTNAGKKCVHYFAIGKKGFHYISQLRLGELSRDRSSITCRWLKNANQDILISKIWALLMRTVCIFLSSQLDDSHFQMHLTCGTRIHCE